MRAVHTVRVPERATVHEYLRDYILANGLKGGIILGIGGFEYAQIGFLNVVSRSYTVKELKGVEEILEVAPIVGNYIVKPDGTVSIHIHVNISTAEGAIAGHLLKAIVNPFLELFLIEVGESVREVFTHR